MERRQHRIYKIHKEEKWWGDLYRLVFDKGNGLVTVRVEKHRKEVFFSDLSVIDMERNKGLGSSILKYVERLTKKEGYSLIQACVEAERTDLLKWYEKRGFKVQEDADIDNDYYKLIEKYI